MFRIKTDDSHEKDPKETQESSGMPLNDWWSNYYSNMRKILDDRDDRYRSTNHSSIVCARKSVGELAEEQVNKLEQSGALPDISKAKEIINNLKNGNGRTGSQLDTQQSVEELEKAVVDLRNCHINNARFKFFPPQMDERDERYYIDDCLRETKALEETINKTTYKHKW